MNACSASAPMPTIGQRAAADRGEGVVQAVAAVVDAVVVGHRQDVDAGGREGREHLLGHPEVELLRLRHAALGDRGLEVQDGDVGRRQLRGDRAPARSPGRRAAARAGPRSARRRRTPGSRAAARWGSARGSAARSSWSWTTAARTWWARPRGPAPCTPRAGSRARRRPPATGRGSRPDATGTVARCRSERAGRLVGRAPAHRPGRGRRPRRRPVRARPPCARDLGRRHPVRGRRARLPVRLRGAGSAARAGRPLDGADRSVGDLARRTRLPGRRPAGARARPGGRGLPGQPVPGAVRGARPGRRPVGARGRPRPRQPGPLRGRARHRRRAGSSRPRPSCSCAAQAISSPAPRSRGRPPRPSRCSTRTSPRT